MWLFVLFLAIPLIEIALFIQIGGAIGLWMTLLIVILTAILGTFMVRQQGSAALMNLRGSFQNLQDPTEPIAHGAMILFSGALLLTPGFFTDAVGFLLLVPGVRSAVLSYARQRVNVATFTYGEGRDPRSHQNLRQSGPDIIDGEYSEVQDPPKKPKSGPSEPSGWTRH